jgi:hypothetical protein
MGFFSKVLPKKRAKRNFKRNVNRALSKLLHAGTSGAVVPMFEDMPTKIDWRAYEIINEQDVTLSPVLKYGEKCGAFRSKISGGGERGRALNKVVQASFGLLDAQEWLAGRSRVEGVAFLYLRGRPHGRFNVLDARGCGGRKLRAGGNYWWDGWEGNDAVRFAPRRGTLNKDDEDTLVDRNRLCVFAPTSDINPEGDTRRALPLLRIAWLSSLLEQAEQVYTERFSLPKEILKRAIEGMNPDDVDNAFIDALGEIEDSLAIDNLAMDSREKMEIIEAKGKTWEFLKELRSKLEARAHKLITGEMQSSGGAGEAGDRGGHELADKQLFFAAKSTMGKLAEAFTIQVIPFLEEINNWWLPEADEDEPPMKWEFLAPIEKQRIQPAEMYAGMDRAVPMKWGFIDAVLGTESGKDPDSFFVSPVALQKTQPMMPSSTGEAEQRKDREVPGSNMPAENEKNPEDLRNVGEEEE